ncbi:MAG: response regulator transcription factor [Arcobacteraceae bacterium]
MQNLKSLKDLKVLLVEDETKLSKFLKDAIAEFFTSLTVAKDGVEGIKKFKKINPDIVITDIMMPNMDGLDMAKELKKLKPNIHIIVLSAFSEKEKLLKAIDIGVNKYFIKPFDTDEVLSYITSIAKSLKNMKTVKITENYSYDKNNKTLYFKEGLIKLTQREREFFSLLMDNQKSIVTLEKIKNVLWANQDTVTPERIRTFIKRLRIKTSKELIENISGQGYMLSKNNI